MENEEKQSLIHIQCKGADGSLDEVAAIIGDREVRCPHFQDEWGFCIKNGAQIYADAGLHTDNLLALKKSDEYRGICPYATGYMSKETRQILSDDFCERFPKSEPSPKEE